MNIKKYIVEQADKDAQKLLTEADILFIQQLAEETFANEEKKKTEKAKNKKSKKKQG